MSQRNKTGILTSLSRYKIYIEGYAWPVSEKYILACDSVTLLVKPHHYDFFHKKSAAGSPILLAYKGRRQMQINKICSRLGQQSQAKAEEIGKAASDFIQDELKMDYVYDYMFHLLNEYAKLMRYEPKIPEGAVEFCSETMVCHAEGLEKKFMMESLVKGPSMARPCNVPPPYEPHVLGAFLKRKLNSIKQVETWEKRYWESLNKQ